VTVQEHGARGVGQVQGLQHTAMTECASNRSRSCAASVKPASREPTDEAHMRPTPMHTPSPPLTMTILELAMNSNANLRCRVEEEE
jgi:hypothetical protein